MAADEGKQAIGRAEAKTVKPHTEGWEAALNGALAEAAEKLGPGQYDVVIRWRAHLDVTNPGQILHYEVVLERTTT